MRRAAGENLKQHRPQAIDIGPVVDLLDIPLGLLGRHVGRRADDVAAERGLHFGRIGDVDGRSGGLGLVGRFGQAPVEHQHFAEAAEDHIFWLQVAVDYAPRVSERNRVADADESLQQAAPL